MPRYLAKFLPGCAPLVAEQLSKSADIRAEEEDIVVFEAARPPYMPFVAQCYRLLGTYGARDMRDLLLAAGADSKWVPVLRGLLQSGSTRLQCMENDKLVAASRQEIQPLETGLYRAGVALERRSGESELRLWLRDGRKGYFLLRVDEGRDKKPAAGALREDLAHMMCLMARVGKRDSCLDPFSGYGSLPRAMASYKPASVTAMDIDRELVKKLSGVPGIRTSVGDALGQNPLTPHGYTVIVTDPPWGLYKAHENEDFLPHMARALRGLLAEGGRVVLLLARTLDAETPMEAEGLTLERGVDILYSGHKAKLLLFRDASADALEEDADA